MKSYLGLIAMCAILTFSSFITGSATTTGAEMENIVVALKSGNASDLSRFFDSRIDLTLSDKSDNYSRVQAEMVLRDFFSNNAVRNFQLRYKGENNGSRYCIGVLQTRSGDYRTRLFMKSKGDKQVVQEITFQPGE
jgi:hypothetical protein